MPSPQRVGDAARRVVEEVGPILRLRARQARLVGEALRPVRPHARDLRELSLDHFVHPHEAEIPLEPTATVGGCLSLVSGISPHPDACYIGAVGAGGMTTVADRAALAGTGGSKR